MLHHLIDGCLARPIDFPPSALFPAHVTLLVSCTCNRGVHKGLDTSFLGCLTEVATSTHFTVVVGRRWWHLHRKRSARSFCCLDQRVEIVEAANGNFYAASCQCFAFACLTAKGEHSLVLLKQRIDDCTTMGACRAYHKNRSVGSHDIFVPSVLVDWLSRMSYAG